VSVTGLTSLQNASAITLNAGGIMSVGALTDGPRASRGSVNLAGGTSLTITDGNQTFSGPIQGAGGLAMTGAGIQTLAGVNSYTGNTTITSGTLRLTGTGSIAGSSRVTVGTAQGSAAVFDVSGVTGGANFANGMPALASGQTLAGHGTVVGPLAIVGGSAVAPGTSVGTLNVGDMTWRGGGRYDFEVAGSTGGFLHGAGSLGPRSLHKPL